MSCDYPLPADRNPHGGKLIIHSRLNPPAKFQLRIPCGKCTGCKLDRSKEWSIRLMHEAQLHKQTSFLTLTYGKTTTAQRVREFAKPHRAPAVAPRSEPEHTEQPRCHTAPGQERSSYLVAPESLNVRHLQLFLKRLRFSTSEHGESTKLKYYACGEYGTKLGRPHYHIALFGQDFTNDRYVWRKSGPNYLFRSDALERAWPHGHSEIGELTTDSAMYIASYVTKKVSGNMADWHYRRTDEAGNDYWLTPEFSLMSRGGRHGRGLGYNWFEQFHTDVYPEDHVINKHGGKMKPPRYYDKLLKEKDLTTSTIITFNRQLRAERTLDDNTPARRQDKQIVRDAKRKQKQRTLEQT